MIFQRWVQKIISLLKPMKSLVLSTDFPWFSQAGQCCREEPDAKRPRNEDSYRGEKKGPNGFSSVSRMVFYLLVN